MGLSSEDPPLVDTCCLAMHHSFLLLIIVLREPTLSFHSHVIQNEFWLPSTNHYVIMLCHSNWFRNKYITLSESIAHVDPLELTLGSFIVPENLWNRLTFFFWMVCMRVWVLDLDVLREVGGSRLTTDTPDVKVTWK